jgi:hypothetical protein
MVRAIILRPKGVMARDRVPYLDDLKSEESLDILLGDPLSKVARAERRTLLGVSTIGIVIAKSGLVPAKITALGIEFDQADQSLLLKMLAWIVVYFLFAFVIYALSDFFAWRIAFKRASSLQHMGRLKGDAQLSDETEADAEEEGWLPRAPKSDEELRKWSDFTWKLLAKEGSPFLYRFSNPVSLMRGVLEFAVPVIIGLVAVVVLIRTPPPRATGKQPAPLAIPAKASQTP